MKALDHKLKWGRPADDYLSLVQQAESVKLEKRRLRGTGAMIDFHSPPRSASHLRINLKKQQVLFYIDMT